MAGKRLTKAVIRKAWKEYVHPGVLADMTYEERACSYGAFEGPFKQGWREATKPAAKRAKRRSK